MPEYTVGVAGCGSIATERHIPAIQRSDRSALRRVYDHKYANAERAASRFDVPGVYDDFDAFVDGLDVITIATPPFVHCELATTALESGTHVLCEKPMAVSESDAETMRETAARTDARLGIVHNFLFANSVRKARRRVQDGAVGRIESVKGFQISSPSRGLPSWYTDLPYDLFFDESPHLLYLMDHFIGALTPQHVTPTFDDGKLASLTATLEGDAGRIGQLTMHFDAPLSEWYLVVIGTRRVLVVDIFRDVLYEFGRETAHSAVEVLSVSLSAVRQILTGVARSGLRLLQDDLYFGFSDLYERYLTAIGTGGALPVDAEEGYRIFTTMYEVINYGDA